MSSCGLTFVLGWGWMNSCLILLFKLPDQKHVGTCNNCVLGPNVITYTFFMVMGCQCPHICLGKEEKVCIRACKRSQLTIKQGLAIGELDWCVYCSWKPPWMLLELKGSRSKLVSCLSPWRCVYHCAHFGSQQPALGAPLSWGSPLRASA